MTDDALTIGWTRAEAETRRTVYRRLLGFTLIVQTVLGLIAEDTGQPVDQVFEDSRHDHWYSADEARDYGFVDGIAESFGQVMPSKKRPFGLRDRSGS